MRWKVLDEIFQNEMWSHRDSEKERIITALSRRYNICQNGPYYMYGRRSKVSKDDQIRLVKIMSLPTF